MNQYSDLDLMYFSIIEIKINLIVSLQFGKIASKCKMDIQNRYLEFTTKVPEHIFRVVELKLQFNTYSAQTGAKNTEFAIIGLYDDK